MTLVFFVHHIHVASAVVVTGKWPSAVRAQTTPLPGVSLHVTSEVRHAGERLGANVTAVYLSLVNALAVKLQVLLVAKILATEVTLEGPLL